MAKHEKDYEIYKIKKKAMEDVIKKAVQQGHEPPPMPEEPEKPVCRRYIVNDATYESLGEILVGNPQGVLSHRDEMMTLLRTLEREDNAAARGFYLTAWDGQSGYTFDRIIRGKQHIESACLSMLGSCQPGRIAEYLRRAINGAEGDDGMIQRFSLMVWPDQNPNWEEVDRYPDTEKRTTAWETFRYLDSLKPESIGAVLDGYRTIPCIKFNIKAQEIFSEWRKNLETLLRSKTLHPALESHLAKYRKMVPTLALINHLAARGQGAVTEDAVKRAITFASYLETHARRAYGSGIAAEADVAKAVLARIRKGDIQDGFTARDVYRNQWSNLSNVEQVQAGLNLLVDCNWLVEREDSQKVAGKAKVNYRISPSAFGAQTYH
jgi:hypothetical protein